MPTEFSCSNMPLPPEAKGTVQGLQTFLNQRGFGPLKVDGVCGYNTFTAWQKYKTALTQKAWNQSSPSNPPSGPYVAPSALVLAPPVPLVPSVVAVPIWKRPAFIATVAGALILVLLLRKK